MSEQCATGSKLKEIAGDAYQVTEDEYERVMALPRG